MKLESINPSLLSFLAGVTTTIAITVALSPTIQTVVLTSQNGVVNVAPALAAPSWHPYILAFPWGLSAILWMLTSNFLQEARHEADLVITPLLSKAEKQEIYKSTVDSVRTACRATLAAAIVLVFSGFAIQWIL